MKTLNQSTSMLWNKAKASLADKDSRQAVAKDAKEALKRRDRRDCGVMDREAVNNYSGGRSSSGSGVPEPHRSGLDVVASVLSR
ncbi:hypothetical protein CF326_g8678 [Tilletia indica]|nr:hypothetical protein CF326_g8678 [Tilletia indica]